MLQLQAVTKTFLANTPNALRALAGIDLHLAEGEFVTVIGSNGAGKSTLLKSITGLVTPDSGTIRLAGQDITRAPVHARAAFIGRIAQDPQESSCASMTIAENLAMAAMRGTPRGLSSAVTAARRTAFHTMLAETGLGLEARLDARMGTLSGGQRQAVALLMATIGSPKLLLLDEHLAALDPRAAELVMRLTARRIAAGRLTTLMITHDMRAALAWGSRLVMLHAGRVILDVGGAEKAALGVADLVARFHAASGEDFSDDRALLTP